MQHIQDLLDVMARLRDPEKGCPWDIQQNFSTIAPYTIEEAYEVADAIAHGDMEHLREELGDLLLQVIFHAQMASEQGLFDFHQIVSELTAKLVRRHPHVFADEHVADEAEVKARWEEGKARERAAKAQHSQMDGIAVALPALARAEKMQKRAAKVGFDWPEVAPVYDKIQEEIREVAEAGSEEHRAEEIGDLLFSVVNLARFYKVDAETALRNANLKFEKRFRMVEQLAAEQGLDMQQCSLTELDQLWDKAKQAQS